MDKSRRFKNLFTSLLIFLAAIAFSLTTYGWSSENDDRWKKIKSEDGIELFSQKVNGLKFKEFKGKTHIQASLASLISLMDDTTAYESWLHFCKEARVIKQISATERYLYFVYDIPVVKDRHVIAHSCVYRASNDDTIFVRLKDASLEEISDLQNEPKFIRKSGVTKVKKLMISWMFIPKENGLAEVIYRVYLDPKPSFLTKVSGRVDPTLEDLVFESVRNMREKVREAKYQDAGPELLDRIPVQNTCF